MRSRAGGRIGHQRADQERHEQLQRIGVQHATTDGARTQNYFAPPGKGRRSKRTRCGASTGRPNRPQQAVLLRSYEGTRDQQIAEPHGLGADRGAAPRRPVRLADADLRSVHRQPERLGRTPFAGNIIPAERIDPTARQPLRPPPLPNLATTGETNNYFVQAPFVLNRWTLDTKVNWSANES